MSRTTKRTAELRQILTEHQREIQSELHSRIRDQRASGRREVSDDVEDSESDAQRELEAALLQMRATMLKHIDEALVRLDQGRYGSCFECGSQIGLRRLRALPFAGRCRTCQEQMEQGQIRARRADGRSAIDPLFPGAFGS